MAWGTYRLLDLNDNPLGSLYEGKVIVDKTYGHASYNCVICCGPNNPWMVYNPMSLTVGGSQNQVVQAINSCSQRLVTVTGDFSTWWTDNTSIATAANSNIHGVGPGTTNQNAQSINMYWGPKADSGGGDCPLSQEAPSAPTNVVGPPDHLVVVVDQQGASASCPSTGVQLRQMQMRVVDVNGNTVANSPSVAESQNPAQPANSCGSGSPQAEGCGPTAPDSTFIDNMTVSRNLCNSGINRSSGCGFSVTSTWSACATSGSNALWVSPRTTKSNLVTVDGNSTRFTAGTICNLTGCH